MKTQGKIKGFIILPNGGEIEFDVKRNPNYNDEIIIGDKRFTLKEQLVSSMIAIRLHISDRLFAEIATSTTKIETNEEETIEVYKFDKLIKL